MTRDDDLLRIDIGLPGDQILQRFLLRRIHREAEFAVAETDGTVHVGFITGFDDRCIQVSTTPEAGGDPRAVLLFWPVRRIEETGRHVGDLGAEDRNRIRRYSHALRSACDRLLSQPRDAVMPTSTPGAFERHDDSLPSGVSGNGRHRSE